MSMSERHVYLLIYVIVYETLKVIEDHEKWCDTSRFNDTWLSQRKPLVYMSAKYAFEVAFNLGIVCDHLSYRRSKIVKTR